MRYYEYRKQWWALLLGLMCAGCVPPSYVNLINGTSQMVTIEIIDSWNPHFHERVTLEPHGRKRIHVIQSAELDVHGEDEAGATRFKQHVSLTVPDEVKYRTGGTSSFSSVEIHFLVTTTGIYPIPKEYRKTWQDHLDAITSEGAS